MSSGEEIWASRLQRELLALTTEQEHFDAPSSTSESTVHNPVGILPSFCSLHESKLDLEHGFCQVSFWIQLPSSIPNYNTQQTDTDNVDSTPTEEEHSQTPPQRVILFTLDASLHRNQRSGSFEPSDSYPFQPPVCILQQGAEYFNFPSWSHADGGVVSTTSTTNDTANITPWIRNGDELLLADCDWTPSLHLNDALLHMALLIRESLQRKEFILKVKDKKSTVATITPTTNATSVADHRLLDEVAQDWNKASHKISGFFSNLKQKAVQFVEEVDSTLAQSVVPSESTTSDLQSQSASRRWVTEENVAMGDTIDLSEAPWNQAVGMYPCKVIHRPRFVIVAMKSHRNLSENQDNHDEDDNFHQVTAAGFSGAGSIFKSFTKSAKSLVEETYLMLTHNLILEITCHKFSVATAKVQFVIPISQLSKLKFKREESISLFFKQSPEDPIIFMCNHSADAVKQIQLTLKAHGVKGKHTNAAMQNVVMEAVEMLEDIRVREHLLEKDPTHQMITDIMDLYRQAAEKFELAGDLRHEQVVTSMKEFLGQSWVMNILQGGSGESKAVDDDNCKTTAVPSPDIPVARGVIHELSTDVTEVSSNPSSLHVRESSQEEQHDVNHEEPLIMETEDKEEKLRKEQEELKKAMEEAESILQSAHDGLADLTIDEFDDDELNFLSSSTAPATTTLGKTEARNDMVAEFEDMLADADKELADIIGS